MSAKPDEICPPDAPGRSAGRASTSGAPTDGTPTIDIRALGICIVYCILSTICILHNKFLLRSLLPQENVILLAQNVFTITLLLLLSSRLVKDSPGGVLSALHLPITVYHSPGDWMIGLCYSFSVISGMFCLGYLSVPMFSSIKKCNIVSSWIIEAAWSPSASTWPTFPAVVSLVAGTVLMTYYDLQFSAIGYLCGAFSCVFQSVAFELGKRLVNHGKDVWSVLLINSIVSVVVLVVYMASTGELQILQSVIGYLFGGTGVIDGFTPQASMNIGQGNYTTIPTFLLIRRRATAASATSIAAGLSQGRLWAHLLFNACCVVAMNYAIFLNCSVNSPLAHAVTGNVKSVVTVLCGIFLFSVPIRLMAGIGIFIGFLGGCWFSWVKMQRVNPPAVQAQRTAIREEELQHVATEIPGHEEDERQPLKSGA